MQRLRGAPVRTPRTGTRVCRARASRVLAGEKIVRKWLVEVRGHPHQAQPRSWYTRVVACRNERCEASDGRSAFGDDDLFTAENTVEQGGQLRLGFVDV